MGKPQEIEFAWLMTAGISITFMLAVAIVLFVVFYQKKLFANQLKLQQLENEQRKNMLIASVQAQENERRRIAGDLHDEVGAILSSSKLYLSHLNQKNPGSSVVIDKIEQLIDKATQNLRDISHNITPQNLEQFGLVSALEEVCLRINQAKSLQVNLSYNHNKRLSIEQELGIYRIAQELLNNTIKHAKASEVMITLEFSISQFKFLYQDNGQGMQLSKDSLQNQSGLGLRNLSSRAELIKAQIDFQSKPQKGFTA